MEDIERKGPGEAHSHPESEYIDVQNGFVLVDYLVDGKVEQACIGKSAVILPGIPHRVDVQGHTIIHTTRKNMDNILIKESLEEFQRKLNPE